jgi:hypothetical protein
MHCSECGQLVKQGAKFCVACGTAVKEDQTSTNQVLPAVVPQITKVLVVEAKHAGSLAIKAFVVALVFSIIGGISLRDNSAHDRTIWNTFVYGIAAVVIVTTLNRWKKNKEFIKGSGIAWGVIVVMALICFGGLVGTSGTSSSPGSGNVASPSEEPKTVALRDVKLDYKWEKSGFGNIMMADFTLKNPTIYRFKDFEISCTHFAPSGTQIDSNTRTIYEVVEPHSTKKINQMNMGFINSQAASSGCKLTDLVVIQ